MFLRLPSFPAEMHLAIVRAWPPSLPVRGCTFDILATQKAQDRLGLVLCPESHGSRLVVLLAHESPHGEPLCSQFGVQETAVPEDRDARGLSGYGQIHVAKELLEWGGGHLGWMIVLAISAVALAVSAYRVRNTWSSWLSAFNIGILAGILYGGFSLI